MKIILPYSCVKNTQCVSSPITNIPFAKTGFKPLHFDNYLQN